MYKFGRLYQCGDGLVFIFGHDGHYYKVVKYYNTYKLSDACLLFGQHKLTNIINFNEVIDTNFITKIYEHWHRNDNNR